MELITGYEDKKYDKLFDAMMAEQKLAKVILAKYGRIEFAFKVKKGEDGCYTIHAFQF